MKVIGLVGPIGAGKDAVSSYLETSHGFRSVVMGDIVRELATMRGMRPTRENLHKLQKAYTDKFGKGFFADQTVKKVLQKWTVRENYEMEIKAVINGIRRLEDASVPKKRFGSDMMLIYVEADEKTRFQRLKGRGNERDPKNYDDFVTQEAAEKRLFSIEALKDQADVIITNNGSIEELHRNLDKILGERGFVKTAIAVMQ